MAEEPTLVREKRKRSKYPLHWYIIALFSAGAGIWAWIALTSQKGPFVLPGYVTSAEVFEQEFLRFFGKSGHSADAEEKFQRAATAMTNRDFSGAAVLLEEASKQAAIPVVFNDLGVLYARVDDAARAVNAFREALARDDAYLATRQNLERLKGLAQANTAYPVTHEIEPNAPLAYANLISLGKSVDAEIAGNESDVDWYRLSAPVPPRDLIQIEIANKTPALTLVVSFCDENNVALAPSQKSAEPGKPVTAVFSAPPNSTVYIRVEGLGGASGPYVLTARALRAFDEFEPNDDLFNATKIVLGQTVQANIMDGQDNDYFSFLSPRTGTVKIDVQNRSKTLIPGLTTFGSDMRTNDFAPDIDNPGESLQHTLRVVEGVIYYLQVWSHADTAGGYTLTVQ
jgi:tetratricopeptide (TPR) repeat protein